MAIPKRYNLQSTATRSWWQLRLLCSKSINCSREIKITRPRDQRVILLYGRKLLIVCNHHARLRGHRYCGSGDRMFLNCHVTSCDQLKFLIVSHHLSKFSEHRPCGTSDTTAIILYVTLQNHVIKGSGDFVEGNSSLCIPALPKLTALDIALMDI